MIFPAVDPQMEGGGGEMRSEVHQTHIQTQRDR